MNGAPSVIIRADAGGALGTGHVMRMLALAQACIERGLGVEMLCAQCPAELVERVRGEGIQVNVGEIGEIGSQSDCERTIARAVESGARWVVLDGYSFDREYQRRLREAETRVLVLDDYGHCESWCVDAILNQNLGADENAYRIETPDCLIMAGARFALLRREFRLAEPPSREDRGPVKRLLVTFGGVDEPNATGRVLEALDAMGESSLEVKALVGVGHPHADSLREAAASSAHAVECLVNVPDMPALYRWADAVVGAGGTTCYEWLFFGLPAAVMAIAENQLPIVSALEKAGLAIPISRGVGVPDRETVEAGLRRLLEMKPLRGEAAVDGWGALRVAATLADSTSILRPARSSDAKMTFEWANDPVVRRNGFHPDPISWETHSSWFESCIRSADDFILIGETIEGEAIGQVRFHRRDEALWEMGILIDEGQRGSGNARELGRLGLLAIHHAAARVSQVVARIKPGNEPSIRLFTGLGFGQIEASENALTLSLEFENGGASDPLLAT